MQGNIPSLIWQATLKALSASSTKPFENVELNKQMDRRLSILHYYKKNHVQSYRYILLKPKYLEDIKFIHTATDSFVIQVIPLDFYKNCVAFNDYVDSSGLPITFANIFFIVFPALVLIHTTMLYSLQISY